MTKFNGYQIEFLENGQYGRAEFDRRVNHAKKLEDQDLITIFADRFTDRESYKAFRKEWKAAYKDLSDQIRHCKKHRKQRVSGTKAGGWASDALRGRFIAHRMMKYLELAKMHAGDLRQAEIDGLEAA